jgi:hypothetical protein
MWEKVRFEFCQHHDTGRYYIAYYFETGWRLQDFDEAAEKARDLMAQIPSNEPFDAVFIIPNDERIDGQNLFGELMRISTDPHNPRIQHTSIIGLSAFSREIFSSAVAVVQKMRRSKAPALSFHSTLEEALAGMKARGMAL